MCEQVVCGQVVCEEVVCGQVVCEEVVRCKLYVDKLCVSKLCVDKLCVLGGWAGRRADGKRAEAGGSAQPKTRTPHKLWGTNKKLWKDPPLLMGKSPISMVMFNSKLFVYQRVGS